MKAGVKIRKAILSVLAIIIVIVSLVLIGTSVLNTPNRYDLVQLNDGWTVSRGNISWKLDNLERSDIGIFNMDDEVILTRTLPQSDVNPATIYFRSILSSIEISVDGDLIYSFGDEYVASGRMLPKMEVFAQLPQDYQGKEITIKITAHENSAFSGLSPVTFGNYNDIKNKLVQEKRLPMVIGVYLCHLGFLLLIIAPFLAFSRNHDFSIFFSAITSVFMGVYILCYNDVFWYISDNPSFYTFLEYFCIFMIPGAILGFILTSGQSNFKILGIMQLIVNTLFALVTAVLHLTNIVHICIFVPFLHVMILVEGIFVIMSLIITAIKLNKEDTNFKNKASSTNILIGALIFFLICALVDIIKYNIMKYSKLGEVNSHINFMTIGALVFIMALLVNYFYHSIEYFSESTIKPQLEGLAYNDALTGLSNRARCEQVLTELSGSFTIISLDLDYLKYTNDNFGHDQGDRLIAGFADILKNSFTDALLLGRMGGDEFIAVLPYVDESRTSRDFSCLEDQLAYRNSTESKLRYSASWGYATSKDKELKGNHSANNVYLLADKRMYTMKNQHHKQSLGRLYDDLVGKLLGEGGKS